MELKVTMEPIGRLQTYVNNAKIHTGEQIEQIKASIREFGFNDPIGVWTNAEGKSEIVEGHGRYIAATELGMETVPVIHLDSLTDEQRRAYTHVHNQLTLSTGWDFSTLELELNSLDFDFGEFGFDELVEDSDFDDDEDLRDEYSQNLGKVVYEPKDTDWAVDDLYNLDSARFDDVLDAIQDQDLRDMLELRRAWFTDFNFSRIADYYAYQATPEEQRAFEALGLVLLDRDQLIENGFADIVNNI